MNKYVYSFGGRTYTFFKINTDDLVSVKTYEFLNNFELSQNYPNPFNPTTIIKYTIPSDVKSETANVKLKVYDVLGKEVATLVNKVQSAGSYEIEFDAKGLTSGVYFYKLKTNGFVETKKMLLLR